MIENLTAVQLLPAGTQVFRNRRCALQAWYQFEDDPELEPEPCMLVEPKKGVTGWAVVAGLPVECHSFDGSWRYRRKVLRVIESKPCEAPVETALRLVFGNRLPAELRRRGPRLFKQDHFEHYVD